MGYVTIDMRGAFNFMNPEISCVRHGVCWVVYDIWMVFVLFSIRYACMGAIHSMCAVRAAMHMCMSATYMSPSESQLYTCTNKCVTTCMYDCVH